MPGKPGTAGRRFPGQFYQTCFSFESNGVGLPPAFAIITAHNPGNRIVSSRENDAADHRLKSRLNQLGLQPTRMTGSSPDKSHMEPGWTAETDLQAAIEIGSDFDQLAIWWIDRDMLYLADCASGEIEKVGRFSSRLLA